ncbi:hypothetical protein J4429_02360 [Candidatus Pacearchaeota archaeon]|nr:hypothetical protein [Candidatus Pacearchaeota archaeon]
MDKSMIDSLIKVKALRFRQLDSERIKSLIESAEKTANFIKTLELKEESSNIIFRELYESIRQLGEARWRIIGYEPLNHEISLDGLIDLDIKEKTMLNHLARFKKIRHDSNYKGIFVSVNQAKEILDFWNKCGEGILEILKKDLNRQINNK